MRRKDLFAAIVILCIIFPTGMFRQAAWAGAPLSDRINEKRLHDPEVRTLSGALTHYVMGIIYDGYGETGLAVAEYEKSAEIDDGHALVYLKLGADLLLKGDLEKAKQALGRAIELEEDNTRPYLLMAIISTAERDFARAETWYKQALVHDPKNLKILTFLSDLFLIQQKLDEAAEIYEKIKDVKQDDPFIHFNLGVIYSKLNRMDKAEESLQRAIDADEEYLEAQMVLGYVYEIEGRASEAIRQYQEVAKLDSFNWEAHLRLSQIYQRIGETDQALQQNRILMRIDIYSPEPYLRNFSIYVAEENYAEAERVLKEALRNGISNALIYASLGYQATLEKDYAKAVDYYTVASEKAPENVTYKFYLAAALDRSGDRKRAIEELEDLVEGEKKIPAEVYNYLGYLLAEENKNLDRAVELIGRALELDPGNGAYLDSLGWAYYKQGRLDEALDYLRQAARALPDDAEVREHLGYVYSAMGRQEDALKEWGKALKLDPGNEKLRQTIKTMDKE